MFNRVVNGWVNNRNKFEFENGMVRIKGASIVVGKNS